MLNIFLYGLPMFAVKVSETFSSLQGESSYAGLPCFFIRLSGCNLRCSYCDTEYAYEEGREVPVAELVDAAVESGMPLVEITGGEPLLQDGFSALAGELLEKSGARVLVETNGSCSLSAVPEGVIAVVDVKCPGSGESGSFREENIALLRQYDEVKFVLSDRADYEWAREFVDSRGITEKCASVQFSPVAGGLAPEELAQWLVEDGLNVKMQLQLHKVLNLK